VTQGSRERFACGLILALPGLAEFTTRWRSTSHAPDHPTLPLERRFPPHVTLLTPWAEPDDVDALARLRTVAERSGPLRLRFTTADQFAGTGVVWLRPDPDPSLTALLDDVLAAFPEYPPYDGQHPEPTLHLTVSADAGPGVLGEVRRALAAAGPLEHDVDRISVYARDQDSIWRETAWVPLGDGCARGCAQAGVIAPVYAHSSVHAGAWSAQVEERP
jgi:2'-5' RNA ligase